MKESLPQTIFEAGDFSSADSPALVISGNQAQSEEWAYVAPATSSVESIRLGIKELDAEEFATLVETWTRETRAYSSVSDIVTHESYQRIIAAGVVALPFILSDLRNYPRHWFYALSLIAGKDVAAEAGALSFGDARAVWIEWGYRNNYI